MTDSFQPLRAPLATKSFAHTVTDDKRQFRRDAQAAKKLLKEYNNLPMPNQNLPEDEIRQYLEYFKGYDKETSANAR